MTRPEPPTDGILIVDDNPSNARLLSYVLRKAGYSVTTATDATEALVAIAGCRPRLIFMDIQLPGISGLDLTRQLKANPITSGIPIIAATAYAMTGDAERAREAGCNDYVTKPIDTRTLLTRVSAWLGSAARQSPPHD